MVENIYIGTVCGGNEVAAIEGGFGKRWYSSYSFYIKAHNSGCNLQIGHKWRTYSISVLSNSLLHNTFVFELTIQFHILITESSKS